MTVPMRLAQRVRFAALGVFVSLAWLASPAALAGPTRITDTSGEQWRLQQFEDTNANPQWVIERLDGAQRPVNGFGSSGRAPVQLGADGDGPSGLRVDAARRVWIFGASMDTGPSQAVVVRLQADGRIDARWGQAGRSAVMPDGLEARANDVLPLADGSVLVAGNVVNEDGDDQAAVWHLQPDGSLDTGFGTKGLWRRPGLGYSNASALAASAQGGWAVAVVLVEGRDTWVEVHAAGPAAPVALTHRERLPAEGSHEVGLSWQSGRWLVQPADAVAQAPAAQAVAQSDPAAASEIGQVGLSPFAGTSAPVAATEATDDSTYFWVALAGALAAAGGWFALRRRGPH